MMTPDNFHKKFGVDKPPQKSLRDRSDNNSSFTEYRRKHWIWWYSMITQVKIELFFNKVWNFIRRFI